MRRTVCIARAESDGTRAQTRFRLSLKRTSPFKSVGVLVHSTAGSRVVRISLINAGYTTFGGGVRVLATHSIRQFPLHFPSRASPCATMFRTSSTSSPTKQQTTKTLLHRHKRHKLLSITQHGNLYRHVPHNDVSVIDRPHIQRWSLVL